MSCQRCQNTREKRDSSATGVEELGDVSKDAMKTKSLNRNEESSKTPLNAMIKELDNLVADMMSSLGPRSSELVDSFEPDISYPK